MLGKDSLYLVEDEDIESYVEDKKECCCFSKMARSFTLVFLVLFSVTLFACLVIANPSRPLKVVVTPEQVALKDSATLDKLAKAAYTVDGSTENKNLDVVHFQLEENDGNVIGSSFMNMEEPSPINPNVLSRFTKDVESSKKVEPATSTKKDLAKNTAVTHVTVVKDTTEEFATTVGPISEPKTEDIPKDVSGMEVSSVNVVNKDTEVPTTSPSTTATPIEALDDQKLIKPLDLFSKLLSWMPVHQKSIYMYPQGQTQTSYYYPQSEHYQMYQPHTSFAYPHQYQYPTYQQYHVPALHHMLFGQSPYRSPLSSLLGTILKNIHTSEPWPTQIHIKDSEVPEVQATESPKEVQTPETKDTEVQTQKPGPPMKLNLNVAGPDGFKAKFSSGMNDEGIIGRARITWG